MPIMLPVNGHRSALFAAHSLSGTNGTHITVLSSQHYLPGDGEHRLKQRRSSEICRQGASAGAGTSGGPEHPSEQPVSQIVAQTNQNIEYRPEGDAQGILKP